MGTLNSLIIPYVTTLPSTPADGQEVYYGADATNGRIWHLRYRAASASSYKWEFIGGSPLDTFTSASATKGAGTTFAALSDSLPTLTIPRAGEYLVRWASNGGNSANSPTYRQFVGIKNASTNPSDNDCCHFPFTSSIVPSRRDNPNFCGFLERLITVAAANDVLQMVMRKDASSPTNAAERRFISARPLRIA
jgi:hypothetical protein